MYAALLPLDAALLVLLTSTKTGGGGGGEGSAGSPEELAHVLKAAKWTAAVALGGTLFLMTFICLLNKPMDQPRTLLINNRYVRLAPRVAVATAIVCLAIKSNMPVRGLVSINVALLFSVVLWEWVAGLEKGAKLFEPKDRDE